MKIEKNSRQIPSSKEICSNKYYSDIVYAYLQCISKRDDGNRYILKKDINYSKIGKLLGLSRQTVSTRFNNLIDLELVELVDDLKYEMKILPRDYAALIPEKTVQLLVDTLSDNAISTYVYLFNRYIANGEQPFVFTLDQIKNWVGISTKTKSNNEVITNILFVLQKIGLIDYEKISVVDQGSTFQNMKSIYQILGVKNKLE